MGTKHLYWILTGPSFALRVHRVNYTPHLNIHITHIGSYTVDVHTTLPPNKTAPPFHKTINLNSLPSSNHQLVHSEAKIMIIRVFVWHNFSLVCIFRKRRYMYISPWPRLIFIQRKLKYSNIFPFPFRKTKTKNIGLFLREIYAL